jgi:hypothetical protein
MTDHPVVSAVPHFCAVCGAPHAAEGSYCAACGAPTRECAPTIDVLVASPRTEPTVHARPTTAPVVAGEYLAQPAIAPGLVDLRVAAEASLAAIAIGIAVTLASWGLSAIGGQDAYLARLADIAFATPVLMGLAAGLVAGRMSAGAPRSSVVVALVSGIAAAAALAAASYEAPATMQVAFRLGFLGTVVGSGLPAALAATLLVVGACAFAWIGWEGMRGRRLASLVTMTVSVLALSLTLPMLWRLGQLLIGLGRLW